MTLEHDTAISCTATGIVILMSGHAMYSYDPRTTDLIKLAGGGGDGGCVDGPGLSAQFNGPRSVVVVDQEFCAYVSDTKNRCIRRVTLPRDFF